MKQLPRSIGTSDELDDEDDLVTPVQQKLLQRILRDMTPGRKTDGLTFAPSTPGVKGKKIRGRKLVEETPFQGAAATPSMQERLEAAVSRGIERSKERMERDPLPVRRVKRATGWEEWEPQGAKKQTRRKK